MSKLRLGWGFLSSSFEMPQLWVCYITWVVTMDIVCCALSFVSQLARATAAQVFDKLLFCTCFFPQDPTAAHFCSCCCFVIWLVKSIFFSSKKKYFMVELLFLLKDPGQFWWGASTVVSTGTCKCWLVVFAALVSASFLRFSILNGCIPGDISGVDPGLPLCSVLVDMRHQSAPRHLLLLQQHCLDSVLGEAGRCCLPWGKC